MSEKPNVDQAESTPEESTTTETAEAVQSPAATTKGSRMRWALVASAFLMAVLVTTGNGLLGWATGAEDGEAFSCGGGAIEGTPLSEQTASELQESIDLTIIEMDQCRENCSQAQFVLLEAYGNELNAHVTDASARSSNNDKLVASQLAFTKAKGVPDQSSMDADQATSVLTKLTQKMEEALLDQDTTQYEVLKEQYMTIIVHAIRADKTQNVNELMGKMPMPEGASAPVLTAEAITELAAVSIPNMGKTLSPAGTTAASTAAQLPVSMLQAQKSQPPKDLTTVGAAPTDPTMIEKAKYSSCKFTYINQAWLNSETLPISVYAALGKYNFVVGAIACVNDTITKIWALQHDTALATQGNYNSPLDNSSYTTGPRAQGVNQRNFIALASMIRLSTLSNVNIEISGYNGIVKELGLFRANMPTTAVGNTLKRKAAVVNAINIDPTDPTLNGATVFESCTFSKMSSITTPGEVSCVSKGKTETFAIHQTLIPQEGPIAPSTGYAILNTAAKAGMKVGFNNLTLHSFKSAFDLSKSEEAVGVAVSAKKSFTSRGDKQYITNVQVVQVLPQADTTIDTDDSASDEAGTETAGNSNNSDSAGDPNEEEEQTAIPTPGQPVTDPASN